MVAAETVTIKSDMRIEHPDYGDITEDVARELAAMRQQDHLRLVADAEVRQANLRRSLPEEAVMHDGFAVRAVIDPAVHAHWRMRHGKEFWNHELDWFLKRNPQCAVKSTPLNPTVRVTATLPGRASRGRRGGRWAL